MNHKILRKFIRNAILEAKISAEEAEERGWPPHLRHLSVRQRGLHGHKRSYVKDHPDADPLSAPGVDPSEIAPEMQEIQIDHSQMLLPDNKELKELRRLLKGHWNFWVQNKEKEFYEFWNGEDSPILAIHWLSLFDRDNVQEEELLESLESYIVEHKPKQGESKRQQPELSCVGNYSPNEPWKNAEGEWNERPFRFVTPHTPVGLVFHERIVTWASYADAWTEFISSAGEEELEHYKDSGLPKRPWTGINPAFVPFGPEDMQHGQLSELIVSSWDWNTVVISKFRCKKAGINPQKIIDLVDRYEIQYIIR